MFYNPKNPVFSCAPTKIMHSRVAMTCYCQIVTVKEKYSDLSKTLLSSIILSLSCVDFNYYDDNHRRNHHWDCEQDD
jgi:hypothetical protein